MRSHAPDVAGPADTAATGAADRDAFSVEVTDESGGLVGGLAAWTWGGLCGIELMWVREDRRKDGWGSRILRAAEEEALRRGCDRVTVSSFTFQAPGSTSATATPRPAAAWASPAATRTSTCSSR